VVAEKERKEGGGPDELHRTSWVKGGGEGAAKTRPQEEEEEGSTHCPLTTPADPNIHPSRARARAFAVSLTLLFLLLLLVFLFVGKGRGGDALVPRHSSSSVCLSFVMSSLSA
jgi:hypothetical protein